MLFCLQVGELRETSCLLRECSCSSPEPARHCHSIAEPTQEQPRVSIKRRRLQVPVCQNFRRAAFLCRAAGRETALPWLMDPEPTSLLNLPEHVCDEILVHLGRASFSTVALVCQRLREAVHRDSLWVQLCEQRWNDLTSVHSWLASEPGSVFNDACRAPVRPVTFRSDFTSKSLPLEQGIQHLQRRGQGSSG